MKNKNLPRKRMGRQKTYFPAVLLYTTQVKKSPACLSEEGMKKGGGGGLLSCNGQSPTLLSLTSQASFETTCGILAVLTKYTTTSDLSYTYCLGYQIPKFPFRTNGWSLGPKTKGGNGKNKGKGEDILGKANLFPSPHPPSKKHHKTQFRF